MHWTFVNESCSFGFVELKDAYYLLPIYCPSQWIFTSCKKVLAPPFKYLRSKKHLSVRYIDESLLLGENFEICFKNIIATVAQVQELAFIKKVSLDSYTTDIIPKVSDRLCQNN